MRTSSLELVPLAELVLLRELSPRERLSEEAVVRYMEAFGALPPIQVQEGSNVVIDGYHRLEAATRLGLETIPVEYVAVPDENLRIEAGVANARHGHPLTRAERNRLAVALVQSLGKLREETAELLGMSASAVTLALREHQFNEMLSEKLGSTVQVINSAHVRALYRVGAEQRERLLEVVVSKVDENGAPYPLTGAELKVLVDRMLDPATPKAELNRLMNDPTARPKVERASAPAQKPAEDPFLGEAPPATGRRPWEEEWESPLKGGDGEAFDRVKAVDEELGGSGPGSSPRDSRIHGGGEAMELSDAADGPAWNPRLQTVGVSSDESSELRQGLVAASRALRDLVPQVEPEPVRRQVEAVMALLESLLS